MNISQPILIELDLFSVLFVSFVCVLGGYVIGYMRGLQWCISFIENLIKKGE